MSKRYIYNPGLLDAYDPMIIRGVAIKARAVVRRRQKQGIKALLSPLWVWIEDDYGNIQSVDKTALITIRSAVDKEIEAADRDAGTCELCGLRFEYCVWHAGKWYCVECLDHHNCSAKVLLHSSD